MRGCLKKHNNENERKNDMTIKHKHLPKNAYHVLIKVGNSYGSSCHYIGLVSIKHQVLFLCWDTSPTTRLPAKTMGLKCGKSPTIWIIHQPTFGAVLCCIVCCAAALEANPNIFWNEAILRKKTIFKKARPVCGMTAPTSPWAVTTPKSIT